LVARLPTKRVACKPLMFNVKEQRIQTNAPLATPSHT
jgi:hypothetical protein